MESQLNTVVQLVPAIGKTVRVQVESWVVPMKVEDVKNVWGKIRLLVVPVSGEGKAWIELSRLQWHDAVKARNLETGKVTVTQIATL